MRTKPVLFVLAATAVLGLAALAPAPAGGQLANDVTVVKVVDGPVPDGAVFEVEVDCVSISNSPTPEGATTFTFEFDENGDPLASDSFQVGPYAECTATETVTNGATVTYGCAVVIPDGAPPAEGEAPAECTDDATVTFFDAFGAQATLTVTNTFEAEPPPDVDDDDVDADVVTATPSFTG